MLCTRSNTKTAPCCYYCCEESSELKSTIKQCHCLVEFTFTERQRPMTPWRAPSMTTGGGKESIGTYYASPKSQFLVPPCLIYVEMLGISAYLIDKNDKTTRTELRSWWDIASKGDKVPSIRNFPRDSRHTLVAVGAHCFGGPRNKQVNAM